MYDIQLELNESGRGEFFIEEKGKQLARMEIGIRGKDLVVYHTEVSQALEGKGIGKKLIEEMVSYARKHHLMVVALCPFVHAQFKRHPEEYADIWKQDLH